MGEAEDLIRVRMEQLLLYARCSERLLGSLTYTRHTLDSLQALVALDPELAPEIMAAMAGLNATHDALTRAFAFADARLTVQQEKPA